MTGLGAADRGDATPPLGRRITIADRTLTVVGVARNGRYDYRVIDEPPEPVVYYSIAQTPGRYAALHVRTEKAALAFAPAIHQAMLDVDPAFTTLSPISLEEYAAGPLMPLRMGLTFLMARHARRSSTDAPRRMKSHRSLRDTGKCIVLAIRSVK